MRTAFVTGIMVTQLYPSSPTIFNIGMDVVICAVLEEVCSPQKAQYGIVWELGARSLVFV